MREYRQLTQEEIGVLENHSCWAENWDNVQVAEAFSPYGFHRVVFYGDIRLGVFEKQVEVTSGFTKHAGINDATLRNVTVGDNCLIEKVGNFINNYTIGDDCYISNICTMETTEGATYGEGHLVSVLNEMGDGNVMLFHDLNSQLAAFMVKHFKDKQLKDNVMRLINEEIQYEGNHQYRGEGRLRNQRRFTPFGLYHPFFQGCQRVYRDGGHLRKLYHLQRLFYHEQCQDAGLFRGRSLPDYQWIYG